MGATLPACRHTVHGTALRTWLHTWVSEDVHTLLPFIEHRINARQEGEDGEVGSSGFLLVFSSCRKDVEVLLLLAFAVASLDNPRHPDKNPGCTGCQARFTEVAVAYEYLMKKKKKDEKESGGQGDARGDGGGEGDEKLHRTTSKDIVDLTVLRPSDVFYPATDRHVWTIMVCTSLEPYETLQELSTAGGHSRRYRSTQTLYGPPDS